MDFKLYLDENTKKLPAGLTSDLFVTWINNFLQSEFDQDLKLASATVCGLYENYEEISLGSIFTHSHDVVLNFNYRPVRDLVCRNCKIEKQYEDDKNGLSHFGLSHVELKEDILKDASYELQQLDNELSSILICTSDKNFEGIIETLKSWEFKILLFANEDAEDSLKESAHLVSMTWFV